MKSNIKKKMATIFIFTRYFVVNLILPQKVFLKTDTNRFQTSCRFSLFFLFENILRF